MPVDFPVSDETIAEVAKLLSLHTEPDETLTAITLVWHFERADGARVAQALLVAPDDREVDRLALIDVAGKALGRAYIEQYVGEHGALPADVVAAMTAMAESDDQ